MTREIYVFMRKSAWLRAAAPAAVLALALTACGSDDDSEDAFTPGAEESEQTEEAARADDDAPAGEADAAEEEEAAAGGASGTLGQGEPSGPVPYEEGGTVADLTITADRVDVGANADLASLNTSADTSGQRPAYVYVTFAHAGGDTLEYPRPISDTSLFLTDGSMAGFVTAFGDLGLPNGCPEGSGDSPPTIGPGEEITMCKTFLIPESVEPGEVTWESGETELTWQLNG
ncbi:hypothetical protein [Streptomyces johnsoniae]|uniref:Lipoprotein n=1 Tax=Streptomyces johnsoniae TaxID=3075532 RepID=A0ABU2S1Y1_9ACTN|nr:hypothetical protein [Streptomyces sp. DSM 41886]MDT0443004.1 hypothetical protein [Streptomyces sp. DSM 41886]